MRIADLTEATEATEVGALTVMADSLEDSGWEVNWTQPGVEFMATKDEIGVTVGQLPAATFYFYCKFLFRSVPDERVMVGVEKDPIVLFGRALRFAHIVRGAAEATGTRPRVKYAAVMMDRDGEALFSLNPETEQVLMMVSPGSLRVDMSDPEAVQKIADMANRRLASP